MFCQYQDFHNNIYKHKFSIINMINKKRGLILASTFLFISLFLIAGVYANPLLTITETLVNLVDMIIEAFEPILGPIMGDIADDEVFSAKLLFFVVIISIVWIGLYQIEIIEDHAWLHWLLAFAVTILATRTLGDEGWLQTILLPYSTLGIAAVAGGPFLVWFLFFNVGMKDKPSIVRKTAWIFFGIVFLFTWVSRTDDSAFLTESGFNAASIYLWTFAATMGMVVLDGTIQKWWRKVELEKATANFKKDASTRLQTLYKQAFDNYESDPSKRNEKKVNHYKKQLIDLGEFK
jgi:hypothetical protein